MSDGTVLFVDQDDKWTDRIKRRFQGEPYEVKFIHNGQTALTLLERSKYEGEIIDVFVTDMRFPDLSGMELLWEINRLEHPPAVIFQTSQASAIRPRTIAAIRAGVYDYLIKPYRLEKLSDSIRGALKERQQAFHDREKLQAYTSITNIVQRTPDEAAAKYCPHPLTHPVILGGLLIDKERITPLQIGNIIVDHRNCTVYIKDKWIKVTQTEVRFLYALAQAGKRPLSYREIARVTHGLEHCENSDASRLLRWHVRNLRHKIPVGYIEQVRGYGYVLRDPEDHVA